MKIRLNKDAPWEEVTLSDGKINKTDWIEDTINYKPIKKWVVFQEEQEIKVDYSLYSKAELVKIAKEKNLQSTGLSKDELIGLLNA